MPASAEGRDFSRPGRAEARPSKESHPAVTALPFREIVNRRKQIFPREIRPQLWRHIHFGIRKLPEQKIGNPHLTRGANQQVRIRIIPGVKMFAEHLWINHRSINVAGFDFAQQTANSIDDLVAATVTERENEGKPGV